MKPAQSVEYAMGILVSSLVKKRDEQDYAKPAARVLGKLPLIRSKNTGVRIVGLLVYALIILVVIKFLLVAVPLPAPSTPTAPQFTVTGLTVSANEVMIGQEVTVTAAVKNIGQIPGTHGVELKVNDVIEEVENVTLVPGESKFVTFRLVEQEPGKYAVGVDNMTQKFTVLWPAVTVDLSDKIDQKGVVREDVEVVSADGFAVLRMLTGTTVVGVDGRPISSITITPTTAPTEPEEYVYMAVGSTYEFTPSGVSFQPPAMLRLSYDPALLPAGTDESQLKLAYHDPAKGWVILEGVIDPEGNFITAQVGALGRFAVLWYIEGHPPIS